MITRARVEVNLADCTTEARWEAKELRALLIKKDMESKDLMIGDWILDGYESAQITSLTCDGIVETTFREFSNIELIAPIPLTSEILKKNGFVYSDIPFEQSWQQFGLSIWGTMGNYHITCGMNISMDVSNVHELQHALRLCGIEKEIMI